MKRLPKILPALFFIASFGLLQSCQQECNCDTKEITDSPNRAGGAVESSAVGGVAVASFKSSLASSVQVEVSSIKNVPTFKYDPKILGSLTPEELEMLRADSKKPLLSEKAANAEAAELVAGIFNSLMGAENTKAQLDVQLLMSEETVKDGIFLFSIRSEEAQDLVFTMYDEEGFQTVANNTFNINEGENYKALNVESLENGNYLFKIRNDETQKELIRRLSIDK
jgi:hypothetical protein